jgi:hypothetical protein
MFDEAAEIELFGRVLHPSTRHFVPFFKYDHLPLRLQETSKPCWEFFVEVVRNGKCGQELSAGLRKLLEAKDCFVRSAL